MNVELVLWLQSGRYFDTLQVPDVGRVPRSRLMRTWPEAGRVATYRESDYSESENLPTILELTFELTTPLIEAASEYALGRRRFHYRELTGWMPAEQLRQRDLYRDRDARFTRLMTAVEKHKALTDAGAFPVHSCALPPGWPTTIRIAPTYDVQGLEGMPITAIHLSFIQKLGLE